MNARGQLFLVTLGGAVLPIVAVAVVLIERHDDGALAPGWVVLAAAGLAVALAVSTATFRVFRLLGAYVDELEGSRVQFREALRRLGDALEASNDRGSLIGVLVETTSLITGTEIVSFHLAVGDHLEPRVTSGLPPGASGRLVEGEGVVGAAAAGRAVRWPPATKGPSPFEPPARSAIAVPIVARGRLYGVLAAYREQGTAPFTASDLDDLTTFAHQAEAALDYTFLQDETKRLSLTDGLTSVWNRRQFELRCAQEVESAHRFGECFAVVICDLDDFKAVNDRYYHAGGDAVLVEFAQRLVEVTREVDFVGRYGGEEFILILPRTDCLGAETVAEHIRKAAADAPFDTGTGPAQVTVSVGIACYPVHGDSRQRLVDAADAALFSAKAAGKNAVRVAPVPGATAPEELR